MGGANPCPTLSCRKYRGLRPITIDRRDQDESEIREREIEMRDTYSVPTDEITITKWHNRAQCIGRDPHEYELDTAEHTGTDRQATARELCDGCEVMRECAAEALEPLARATVRAGVWIPFTMPRGVTARVREALPDDLTELLEPAQGASERRSHRAPRRASAPASLTPVGQPPRNDAGAAPCGRVGAVGGRGGRG